MRIYIKDMEIPTHCIDCPFMISCDNDDCILQSAEANENFENWEQMKAGCPLVTIPPHGRLIDADEFLHRALRTKCFDEDYARMLQELVGESITIIPAEEDE